MSSELIVVETFAAETATIQAVIQPAENVEDQRYGFRYEIHTEVNGVVYKALTNPDWLETTDMIGWRDVNIIWPYLDSCHSYGTVKGDENKCFGDFNFEGVSHRIIANKESLDQFLEKCLFSGIPFGWRYRELQAIENGETGFSPAMILTRGEFLTLMPLCLSDNGIKINVLDQDMNLEIVERGEEKYLVFPSGEKLAGMIVAYFEKQDYDQFLIDRSQYAA